MDTLLILTILERHSRVVYPFGVVIPKKLVSFLTKNKFGVVFSTDTLLKNSLLTPTDVCMDVGLGQEDKHCNF